MTESPALGVPVVRVFMNDNLVGGKPAVRLWAAAVPHEEAVKAVLRDLPSQWTAELATDIHLFHLIPMKPGTVRELTELYDEQGNWKFPPHQGAH